MARMLLDTHSFLWFVTEDAKLSAVAERLIADAANEPILSAACVWEIAIKVSIGRLPIPAPIESFIPEQLRINRISLLPIELKHLFEITRMPLHHRDPFDRMLIAQAIVEGLPVVGADPAFDKYPIQRLW
jgi:PIN domain nuclease of toxin-antitoxin system